MCAFLHFVRRVLKSVLSSDKFYESYQEESRKKREENKLFDFHLLAQTDEIGRF